MTLKRTDLEEEYIKQKKGVKWKARHPSHWHGCVDAPLLSGDTFCSHVQGAINPEVLFSLRLSWRIMENTSVF